MIRLVVALNDRFAIEPPDYRCAACAAEVAVESPFFSAVCFEGESLRRKSYCPPCWGAPRDGPSPAYASWKSRRPRPEAPPRRVRFDPDLLLEFFRRLGETPPAAAGGSPAPPEALEAQKARLRLVVALLLVRRKVLVFESAVSREGREWLKLSEKADPARVHQVENPPLTEVQVEEVKTGLGDLLQMDLG